MQHFVIESSHDYLFTTTYSDDVLVLTLDVYGLEQKQKYQLMMYSNNTPNWIITHFGSIDSLYKKLKQKNDICFEVYPHKSSITFISNLHNKNNIIQITLQPKNRQNSKIDTIFHLQQYLLPKFDVNKMKIQPYPVQKLIQSKEQSQHNNNRIQEGSSRLLRNRTKKNIYVDDYQSKFKDNHKNKHKNKYKNNNNNKNNHSKNNTDNTNNINNTNNTNNTNNMPDKSAFSCIAAQKQQPTNLQKNKQKQKTKQNQQSMVQNNTNLNSIHDNNNQNNKLLLDIEYLKNTINQLQKICTHQQQQIEKLKQKNNKLQKIQQTYDKKLKDITQLFEKQNNYINCSDNISLIKKQNIAQKYMQVQQNIINIGIKSVRSQWRIDEQYGDIQNFIIEGARIIYNPKPTNTKSWSFIYLKNAITFHKPYSIKILINKCPKQHLAFGITYQHNPQKQQIWYQKNCYEYVGFSKTVFECGKVKLVSGHGLLQGVSYKMTVNLKNGAIQWQSQRGIEAQLQSRNLVSQRNKYVAFIRFKDPGDSIQFLDAI